MTKVLYSFAKENRLLNLWGPRRGDRDSKEKKIEKKAKRKKQKRRRNIPSRERRKKLFDRKAVQRWTRYETIAIEEL